MRCSTLELEEDDTKGISVPCRLLEYTKWHKKNGNFWKTQQKLKKSKKKKFIDRNFFSWISSIFVGFFKSSRFFVSPSITGASELQEIIMKVYILTGEFKLQTG